MFEMQPLWGWCVWGGWGRLRSCEIIAQRNFKETTSHVRSKTADCHYAVMSRNTGVTRVEKCLELWMEVNVYFGAGPSGKVDTNKRKEARTLEQNGGCLMGKKKPKKHHLFRNTGVNGNKACSFCNLIDSI